MNLTTEFRLSTVTRITKVEELDKLLAEVGGFENLVVTSKQVNPDTFMPEIEVGVLQDEQQTGGIREISRKKFIIPMEVCVVWKGLSDK